MRIALPVLPLLFLSLSLTAQSNSGSSDPSAAPTPQPTPEPGVRVLFSVYVWTDQQILMEGATPTGVPTVYYDSPTGLKEIPLTRNSSTPLYPYQGPLPLRLYQVTKERGEPLPGAPIGTRPQSTLNKKPLVEAVFSNDLDRVMIMISPGRRDSRGVIQSVVFDYDSEALGQGMSRIYNGTNKPLAMTFADNDEKMFKLEPNSILDFNPDDVTDSNYPRVYIYGMMPNQRLKRLHTNKLYFKEGSTNIFMIYPQGRRRVRIMDVGKHENVETEKMFPTPTPEPGYPVPTPRGRF